MFGERSESPGRRMARRALLLVVGLWTCGVVSGAEAEAGWLSAWGAGLRAGLGGALQPALVHYDEPDINTTYISRSDFDMRAMGHLYNSTKLIIDVIADKQAYPEG